MHLVGGGILGIDEAVASVSSTAIVYLDVRGCSNISADAVLGMLQFRASLEDSNLVRTAS